MMTAEVSLRAGLQSLQLSLSDQQIAQLLAYMDLIGKWTKVYNLTAVRDPADMMTHHLLDSLAVIKPLQRYLQGAGLEQGAKVLDVGSGAGLPGVVIAICCPDVAVSCVDTVAKKAAFIKQAALALKLANLTGLHARVESLSEPFDVVCSRAFASLLDFTNWSGDALAPKGVWMALKGKHPVNELADLPESIEVFHVEQLQVPGLEADRCILWLQRKA
ncbi:ribosomal RNA small subunit methyltransferase G [Polaromonas sp.]|nr:ribosomal RNA small subunit methyltransferase G [Polaromonas sp.]